MDDELKWQWRSNGSTGICDVLRYQLNYTNAFTLNTKPIIIRNTIKLIVILIVLATLIMLTHINQQTLRYDQISFQLEQLQSSNAGSQALSIHMCTQFDEF